MRFEPDWPGRACKSSPTLSSCYEAGVVKEQRCVLSLLRVGGWVSLSSFLSPFVLHTEQCIMFLDWFRTSHSKNEFCLGAVVWFAFSFSSYFRFFFSVSLSSLMSKFLPSSVPRTLRTPVIIFDSCPFHQQNASNLHGTLQIDEL